MIEIITNITDRKRIIGIRVAALESFVRILKKDRKASVGFLIVISAILLAIFAPLIAPYHPMAQDFTLLTPPSFGENPLGTDSYGRDMLSRLIHGARVSLFAGIMSVSLGSLVGVSIGLIAGYYGGIVDHVLMRFIDWMWAFPYLLVAIFLLVIFGASLWNVIFALAFGFVDDFARITRSEILSIREQEYILAAESIGMGNIGIMVSEALPNAMAPIIVEFTVLVARAMIAEATLSFLGLGVSPGTPTWGMQLGEGRDYLRTAWWISVLPGVCITITVLGINLFGDALRDALDVKDDGGGV